MVHTMHLYIGDWIAQWFMPLTLVQEVIGLNPGEQDSARLLTVFLV